MYCIRTYGPDGTWGKVIDEPPGIRTYITHRKRAEHFHKKSQSWGIDLEVLNDLRKLNVEDIRIYVDDEALILRALVRDFVKHGKVMRFPPFEAQTFLKESYFKPMNDGCISIKNKTTKSLDEFVR